MDEKNIKIHTAFSKTEVERFSASDIEIDKPSAEEVEVLKKRAEKISLNRPFSGETSFNADDTATLNESFNASVSYAKVEFTDSVEPVDTANTRMSMLNTLSDTAGLADDTTKTLDIKFLDTVNSEEVTKFLLHMRETYSSEVTIVDSIQIDELLRFSEQIEIVSDFIQTALLQQPLSDAVNIQESLNIILNSSILQTFSDTATTEDDISFSVSGINEVSDSVSVLDKLTSRLAIPTSFSDTLTSDDSIITRNALIAELSDSVTITDELTSVNSTRVQLTEVIIADDELISIMSMIQPVSSSLSIAEAFNAANDIDHIIPIDTVVNTSEQEFDDSTRYFIYGIFADDVLVSFLILGVRDTTLVSPLNTNVAGNVTFTWNPAENATGYDLQVATASNFLSGVIVNLTNLASTSYSVTSPLANNIYYWRVRGRNNTTGKIGNWTSNGTFTVISLTAPVFIYPKASQNTGLTATASWNLVSVAASYDLQLSTDSNFGSTLINVNTTNTSYLLPTLTKNTTYYIRVRSKNGSLISSWSTVTFTTTVVSLVDSTSVTDAPIKSTMIMGNTLNDSASSSEEISSVVTTPEQILSDKFYPYQLLTNDPTTKVLINWIDDNDSYLGTNQTLRYGLEGQALSNSIVVSPQSIPNSNKKLYSAEITGLTPNTTHSFLIDNDPVESYEFKFKTQKSTLGSDEYKVAFVSDIHIDYTDGASMNTSSRMAQVKAQTPNIICFIGDIVSNSHTPDTTKSNEYIRFFKEHVNTQLNTNRVLQPMVNVPGNHDVGELNDNPTKTRGYFQLFWNTFKTYNSGNNLGSIKIGNYLRLVGLDLFSDTVTNNANLINNLPDDTDYVIPFSHFPILPSTTRQSWDSAIFESVAQNIAPALNNKPKIKAYFTGHMHTRYQSKKWQVSTIEGTPLNKTSLGNNNYIIESFNPLFKQEFGQGYRNNRTLANVTLNGNLYGNTAWYVENVLSHAEGTFYVVRLKASNALFTVEAYNSTSSTATLLNSYNMLENTKLGLVYPEDGDIVPNDWTVMKINPVENDVVGVTQYTIGITGDTRVNTSNDFIRTRSSYDLGTTQTVLSSGVTTANPKAITISDTVTFNENNIIRFVRTAGGSNYQLRLSESGDLNNPDLTLNLSQIAVNGLYPKTEQEILLTDIVGYDTEKLYYFRIDATVPEDGGLKVGSVRITGTVKPPPEPGEGDYAGSNELILALDEGDWE
jgi:hypothetical protein